ncbi:MAG TPA: helix-turn-helix domain-containing protein [Haliangium sp.]|nr:helix-turn-helix domain-containing protein [Haliangium sp.]
MFDETTQVRPRLVSVASGKGGAGKSLLAANIGIFLATLNKRVILIDGALGSPNLHMFTGMHRPGRTLTDALEGVSMSELAEPTPVPGLQIVSGAHDPMWAANLKPSQGRQLMDAMRMLPVDFVVLDLNAGTSSQTLDWYLEADVGVLVTTAEPTSVQLCYRFIRGAFMRKLRDAGLLRAVQRVMARLPRPEGGIPAPLDLYEQTRATEPDLAQAIAVQVQQFQPHLVVNSARSKSDMELGPAVSSAARRRLGVPVVYLGHLEYDEAVWAAVQRSRPLLVEHPEARVSKCIEKVTRRLLAGRDSAAEPPAVGVAPTHYDLLGIEPTASFEDIRRANRRTRELYGRESMVISGLYTDVELDGVHRAFDEAYTVLMDASRRKSYDLELFPEGVPSQVLEPHSNPVKLEIPPSERPPMPDIGEDTAFTGMLLRQVREARGIDLREIAERTKIGMAYLQALEDENFAKLPAVVYVRGFLAEYAKILSLERSRVIESYLSRFRAARRQPDSVTGGRAS